MLRVGLTGGLGSGKSTVAAMLAERGAHVLSADELGRALMEPGTPVFAAIVERFGPHVLDAGGRLDRSLLARLAFTEGRVEELNAIVHPATLAEQARLADAIVAQDAGAVVVVESALIFETRHGRGWRERFDRLVLVTAPDALKIARFVARSIARSAGDPEVLAAEAGKRLARMLPDAEKAPQCDYVLANTGTLAALRAQVEPMWRELAAASAQTA